MRKTLWSSEAMGTAGSRWRIKESLGGWQSLEVLRPCALFSCGLQWVLRSPGSSPIDHHLWNVLLGEVPVSRCLVNSNWLPALPLPVP